MRQLGDRQMATNTALMTAGEQEAPDSAVAMSLCCEIPSQECAAVPPGERRGLFEYFSYLSVACRDHLEWQADNRRDQIRRRHLAQDWRERDDGASVPVYCGPRRRTCAAHLLRALVVPPKDSDSLRHPLLYQ